MKNSILKSASRATWVVILASMCMSISLRAQVSQTYAFSKSSGTYTPITGGTLLIPAVFDDTLAQIVTPSYKYDGITYNNIGVNSNGHIYIGTGSFSTGDYTPISALTTAAGVISPFGRDLNNAASGSPSVRWAIVGTEIVIQWQDARRYSTSASNTERFSFQCRIDTMTGVIKMVYSAVTGITTVSSFPEIGLRGPSNSLIDVNNITIGSTGSWSSPSAGVNNSDIMYFDQSTGVVPTSGQTYTWKPVSCKKLQTTYLVVQDADSAIIAWQSPKDVPLGYIWKLVASGSSPSGTAVASGYVAYPGYYTSTGGVLVSGNKYDFYLAKVCAVGDTSTWSDATSVNAPCNVGAPVVGAVTGASGGCTLTPFTLVLSGNSPGSAVQWQSSPDSLTWTDETGATTDTFNSVLATTTYYRVKVTCGTSAYTPVVKMYLNPPTLCYCTNALGGGCGGNNIDTLSIPTTTFNVINSTCNTTANFDAYTVFAATGANTCTLTAGNTYSMHIAMSGTSISSLWIDYNQNGLFESTEWIQLTFAATNGTASFLVPSSALTGLTGMRVRSRNQGNPNGSFDACSNFGSGETNDFTINIIAGTGSTCNNPPVAGTITGTPVTCTGTTMTVAGYTAGTSLQWQSSPDSIAWTNVSGAKSSTLMDTPTVVKYYRVKVKCTDSVYTAGYKVTPLAASLCYCTIGIGGFCGGNDIDTIIIPTTTFNVVNAICNTNANGDAYTAFAATGANTCTLIAGNTYSMHIAMTGTSISSLWIDYNKDGIYSASEWIQLTFSANSGTASFTVPAGALNGLTGMRVRSRAQGNPNGAPDACLNFGSGETNDFIVTITAIPHSACTNPPVAGVITADVSVCGQYTLLVNGTSSAPYIQWEKSTDSIIWTTLVGDTNRNLIVSANVQAYYRVKARCIDSAYTAGFRIDSGIVQPSCYCVNNLGGSCFSVNIDSFNIVSTALNSKTPICNGPYTALPRSGATTATMTVGNTYTSNVFLSTSGQAQGWIDYDHSGTYDAQEFIFFTNGSTSGTTAITIPTYAKGGETGMRIRSNYSFNTVTATDACSQYFNGVTQDFLITINRPSVIVCPALNAGVLSGDSTVCIGKAANISTSGYTNSAGIQWQSSLNGTTWVDIVGAHQANLKDSPAVATYYRLYVYCDTDKVYSTSLKVKLNQSYECYCSGNLGGGCGFGYAINNVTIANTPLNNSSGCSSGTVFGVQSYTLYLASPTTTATLYKSTNANIQLTSSSSGNTIGGVWIDYNQDGFFAPNEFTLVPFNAFAGSVYVPIPASAKSGKTGMRVRTNFYSTFSNNMKPTDACTNFGSGETEDYVVTIDTLPAALCPSTPQAGTISGSHTYCPGISVSLGLTGQSTYADVQWQFSLDSITWFNLPGATIPSVTVAPIIPLYYRAKVSCSSSSYTAAFWVSQAPATQCYCNTNLGGGCGFGYDINNVSVIHTTLNNNSLCTSNVNGDDYTLYPDTASATATLYRGVTHDFSTIVSGVNTSIVAVWIDYDQSGTYDANEFDTLSYILNSNKLTRKILIPSTAKLGKTGMRFRSNFLSTFSPTITPTDPCTNFFDGETEDYIITIDTLPANICSNPPQLVGGKPTITDVTCFGKFTGAIKDSFTWSYNLPYWHKWMSTDSNNVIVDDTATSINTLHAGVYYDTMTFAFICTKILGPDTVRSTPQILSVIDSAITVKCSGDKNGSLYISVTGGYPPYKHLWNSGDTTEDLQNVYGGIYIDVITDSSGCASTQKADTIKSPKLIFAVLDSIKPVSCLGGVNDGKISIRPGGGTPPYTHHWSNGDTTEDIINLGVGAYTDTITDANGCKSFVFGPQTITQPTTTVSATIDSSRNAKCYGAADGAIFTTALGGTPPYSYIWAGTTNVPTTMSDPVVLLAGTYTVTVKDANGCSVALTSPTVITQDKQITVTTDSILPTLCAGVPTGVIKVHVDSAFGTTTYLWSNGATTQNLAQLAAGVYQMTVTDANGCTAVSSQDSVGNTINFTAIIDSAHNVSCNGGNTGYARAIGVGGLPGYSYVWGIGSTNRQLVNISAGTYDVSVTDGNGCTALAIANITEPTAIKVNVDSTRAASCVGAATGAAYITARGGVKPYSYLWSNGATTRNITGVVAAIYTVVVTDSNGCTMSGTATIINKAPFAVLDTIRNAQCFGSADGSIHLGTTGAISPVTYSWSNAATTPAINSLAAGTFIVTVTDGTGCSSVKTYIVTQPTPLALTTVVTKQIQGGALGSDSAIVTGGTTPYTYSWSNGATGAVAQSLVANKYCVTVTDANGCTITACDSVGVVSGLAQVDNISKINIYPNPSTGRFNIDVELTAATANEVNIYTVEGQLVYHAAKDAANNSRYIVDLGNDAAGVYIVRISTAGYSINRRITVAK
jgi:hypothetical protein